MTRVVYFWSSLIENSSFAYIQGLTFYWIQTCVVSVDNKREFIMKVVPSIYKHTLNNRQARCISVFKSLPISYLYFDWSITGECGCWTSLLLHSQCLDMILLINYTHTHTHADNSFIPRLKMYVFGFGWMHISI